MTLKPLPMTAEELTTLSKFPQIEMDGMSSEDVISLNYLADNCGEHPLIIEVGSWKGHSTWLLARVAKEKGGKVICVDHWKGSPTVQHHLDEVKEKDILAVFRSNMRLLGMENHVFTMAMDSLTASSILKDRIADMIFIDADHRYSSILQDIKAWYPKLKIGGTFCGHDCNRFFEECTVEEQNEITTAPDVDFNSHLKVHPGVVRAVHEVFGMTTRRFINSSVWFKKEMYACSSKPE